MIRVGTPVEDGVEFDFEITNSETISKLRTLIKEEVQEIEQPNGVDDVAEAFFSLDRSKAGTAEIRNHVWYEGDGAAILFDEFRYYT